MFDLKTMEEGSYYLAWKEDNRLFGKWKAFNYCPACGSNLIDIYLEKGFLVKKKGA